MNSSSLTILGFLLLSAPALAGDVYSFTVDQQGGGGSFLQAGKHVFDSGDARGTVLVEGRKYRLELAPDPELSRPYQAVISNDGGKRELALSLKDHTYFESAAASITSPLFNLLPIPGQRSVSNVKLDVKEAPEPEMIPGGGPARRHEIKLSFDLTLEIPPPAGMPPGFKGHTEKIQGKVSVEAVYWLAAGSAPVLPRLLRPAIHTGFPEIDSKLDGTLAALQGVPVKQQVTISTSGDQGTESRTSIRTVLLENHKTREMKASSFEVPAGFKMHEPEFSGPGLGVLPPQ
jgi:hypothetical protein